MCGSGGYCTAWKRNPLLHVLLASLSLHDRCKVEFIKNHQHPQPSAEPIWIGVPAVRNYDDFCSAIVASFLVWTDFTLFTFSKSQNIVSILLQWQLPPSETSEDETWLGLLVFVIWNCIRCWRVGFLSSPRCEVSVSVFLLQNFKWNGSISC